MQKVHKWDLKDWLDSESVNLSKFKWYHELYIKVLKQCTNGKQNKNYINISKTTTDRLKAHGYKNIFR